MRNRQKQLAEMAHRFWTRLREWCGDAAYERYLRSATRQAHGRIATPEQFYLQQLERKYSKPNRCC